MTPRSAVFIAFMLALTTALWAAGALATPGQRERLLYAPGSAQELEVYKIYGREPGPTVMIMGGIQGNEPGAFLSADLYADLAVRRGNLIVVPRANFKSIIKFQRGPDGDMNRKFQGDLSGDPDGQTVRILKELIAESDLLLNLHDGSGFYRPHWESEMANPNRYGQCIIADAAVYTHPLTGQSLPLAHYAQQVVDKINEEISEPLYKFHFFNTRTGEQDSPYKEQRGSATWFALTELGIPAYGVETSKNLPNLEMKVYQHNLAVNAFLEIFGVKLEQPPLKLEPPRLAYALIRVNGTAPLALTDGQTLRLNYGDRVELIHLAANYERGLSADFIGLGELNDLGRVLELRQNCSLELRKDQHLLGRLQLELRPQGEKGPPQVLGEASLASLRPAKIIEPVLLTELSDSFPSLPQAVSQPLTLPPAASSPSTAEGSLLTEAPAPVEAELQAPGPIEGFILEIDGRRVEVAAGEKVRVLAGSRLKMVDFKSSGPPPASVVMNLKGFVPPSRQSRNNGEDRGSTADTASDMMPAFSKGRRGREYELNAEKGKEILASAIVEIVQPKLESVNFTINGQAHTLKLGQRLTIASGTKVVLTNVTLANGQELSNPRLTLGGRPFPAELPQTLTMPSFAANLAVFNGQALAGKVTWALR